MTARTVTAFTYKGHHAKLNPDGWWDVYRYVLREPYFVGATCGTTQDARNLIDAIARDAQPAGAL